MHRVFNYPWSGRLGRIVEHCPWCGDDGPRFQMSSRMGCGNCSSDQPMPDEEARQFEAKYEALARRWCEQNGLDYDKVVTYFAEKYGEIWQTDPPRIQESNEDSLDTLKAL